MSDISIQVNHWSLALLIISCLLYDSFVAPAKTQGGTLEAPVYIHVGNVVYSSDRKDTGKKSWFLWTCPTKGQRNALKGSTTCSQLINDMIYRVYLEDKSSSRTSQVRRRVKFESWAKFESGSNFSFSFFSFLFISSDCYSHNDVQVVNGKIIFQVCSIFHYWSLEPLALWFTAVVERYATSLCVHIFPKKIKTCSCIHLKQRYYFHDWKKTDGDEVLHAWLKRHLVASTGHPCRIT